MLLSTSQRSSRLSRRTRLSITSATVLACLLPTLRYAPARAEAQSEAKANGRIYVSATLRLKAEGQGEQKTKLNAIIAIDPATGEWQLIAENGINPRVSPDRRALVFTRFEQGCPDGIWKCERDGQFPLKISFQQGRAVWSPDGKYLVATKQENLDNENDKTRTTAAWKCETWRIDADGRNPVKLSIPDTSWVADWSADGQWFLTGTDRHPPFGRGYQLYVIKTDGTHERRLTEGGLNVYARFSPDGKKILYLHQTAKDGNSIWTVDVDGSNAREIVKEVGLASPNGAFWSPDSKQVAVIMFNWELDESGKKVGFAGSDKANPRIEIMDADGTNRRGLKLQGATFTLIGSLGDWR